MTDQWTDRLSELVDGELAGDDRLALERHLSECAECAQTVDELRQVVRLAAALEDRPTARDLWPGIDARIREGERGGVVELGSRKRRRRSLTLSIPQLAAAAIALMLVSGGAVWLLMPGGRGPATGTTASAVMAGSEVTLAGASTAQYDMAVAELEAALAVGRRRLDSVTVRVIEENLRIIDRAIAQARSALVADPENPYLYTSLAESMRRKVKLLRQATLLAAASS